MQWGDAEHGVVDAVTFQMAVAEDLPGLHSGEGVLDAGADLAVGGVVYFFSCREFALAPLTVVRDDQTGAPAAAVHDQHRVLPEPLALLQCQRRPEVVDDTVRRRLRHPEQRARVGAASGPAGPGPPAAGSRGGSCGPGPRPRVAVLRGACRTDADSAP